jgi:hypothetical protein
MGITDEMEKNMALEIWRPGLGCARTVSSDGKDG